MTTTLPPTLTPDQVVANDRTVQALLAYQQETGANVEELENLDPLNSSDKSQSLQITERAISQLADKPRSAWEKFFPSKNLQHVEATLQLHLEALTARLLPKLLHASPQTRSHTAKVGALLQTEYPAPKNLEIPLPPKSWENPISALGGILFANLTKQEKAELSLR